MTTTKSLVLVVVLFAAAAFIGGYLVRGARTDSSPTPTPSPISEVSVLTTPRVTPTPVPPTTLPRLYTVRLTSSGPLPKTLTVHAGDAIQLKNLTGTGLWPVGDCSGFDARRTLENGESYTLTFPDRKICAYHNQLVPSDTTVQGTIIVE